MSVSPVNDVEPIFTGVPDTNSKSRNCESGAGFFAFAFFLCQQGERRLDRDARFLCHQHRSPVVRQVRASHIAIQGLLLQTLHLRHAHAPELYGAQR